MGEAQRGEAGEGVRMVAERVLRLLGRRAMEAEAVGFHDEFQLGPVEVDAVAVQPGLRLWPRKAALRAIGTKRCSSSPPGGRRAAAARVPA